LTLFPETVRKKGNGYFYVMTECKHCHKRREKELRNMEKGFSSKCQCQNKRYYGDPRVPTLSKRYGAMVQRCERDSHVSSHRYKGRGIRVLFKDIRDFVNWALKKWPDTDFKGLNFARKNNDGHYTKSNLRLVDRTTNLLNMSSTNAINIGQAREFLKDHPEVTYTERTVLGRLRSGMTWEQLLAHHKTSPRAVGRRKLTPVGKPGFTTSSMPDPVTASPVPVS
jgi:hypothetical protein